MRKLALALVTALMLTLLPAALAQEAEAPDLPSVYLWFQDTGIDMRGLLSKVPTMEAMKAYEDVWMASPLWIHHMNDGELDWAVSYEKDGTVTMASVTDVRGEDVVIPEMTFTYTDGALQSVSFLYGEEDIPLLIADYAKDGRLASYRYLPDGLHTLWYRGDGTFAWDMGTVEFSEYYQLIETYGEPQVIGDPEGPGGLQ